MKGVGTSDNFRSATSRPRPARSRPYRACPREKLSEVPTTSPTGAETARPRSGRLPYGGEGSTPPLPARLFCGRRADCGAYSPCSERSEEHTSELQSLMRISYAVFCLKKKKK